MREAIILAGGKGTRIQHILPGIPKCMAPINGIPFIEYIIEYLIKQRVDHFIFSLGHLHEDITNYLNTSFPDLKKSFIIEQSPLGTGGAIVKSLVCSKSNYVYILNGDTYFPVSLDEMEKLCDNSKSDLVIASTLVKNPDRFGTISFDKEQKIMSFHEKRVLESGYINGGTYLIFKNKLMNEGLPEVFSFETEILEAKVKQWNMYSSIQDVFFIDIGIPEDYLRAQTLLPNINSTK